MSGLWSMAGQRACHCRARLRVTRTSTRRATTSAAGAPRRQKVEASDVFTACYTAIMATAAVADASRKDHRRRELDRQIAEAKSDLARTLEASHAQDLAAALDSPYPEVPYDRQPQMLDILHDLSRLLPNHQKKIVKIRDLQAQMLAKRRREVGMTLFVAEPIRAKPQTLFQCMNLMAAEDKDPGQSHREPRNDTEFAKMSGMVTDMVDLLMADAYYKTELEAPGTHPNFYSPDSAATMIRMLRSDGYPNYSHVDLDPAAAIQHRASLNEINTKILEEWAPQLRERLVAKICYNLLVCPVIPNMQNYNTLILGFALVGEFSLAQIVVDSFLHLSHMKPTGATYLCLLHHYRLKGDIVGFHAILRRFFAQDPRGIGLKRRTIASVKKDPNVRAWARSTDVGLVKDYWVMERAPLNKDLIEAMMEGLIGFDMLRHAAQVFVSCLSQNWLIEHDLVYRLFHACLIWLDTEAIKLIIRGLLDHMDKTSALLLGPEALPFTVVRQLRYMLGVLQGTMFGTTDRASDEEPLPSSPDEPQHAATKQPQKKNMDRLASAIWLRHELSHQRTMCFWLPVARSKLDNRRVPLEVRLDRAAAIVDRGLELSRRGLRKTEFIKNTTHLMWIAEAVTDGEEQVSTFRTQICHRLEKLVPRAVRDLVWPDPDMDIAERIAAVRPYTTPGSFTYEMVECFRDHRYIELAATNAILDAMPPTRQAEGLRKTREFLGCVALDPVVEHFHMCLEELEKEETAKKKEETAKKKEETAKKKKETAKKKKKETAKTVDSYLEGLEQKEKARAKKEAADENDPFAQLLESIPKPSSIFKGKKGRLRAAQEVGEQGW